MKHPFLLPFLLLFSIHFSAQAPWKQKFELANHSFDEGNYAESATLMEDIIEQFKLSPEELSEICYSLGYAYEKLGKKEMAKKTYLISSQQKPFNLYGLKSINSIGIVFRYEAAPDSAYFYFSKAAEFAQQFLYPSPFSNLAWHYKEKGRFDKALENHLKALKIDITNNDSLGIAVDLTNLSEIEKFRKNYKKAISHAELSNEIQWRHKVDKSLSRNYENLGHLSAFEGKIPEAIDWHKRALENDRLNDNKRGIAFSTMHLGDIYCVNGQFQRGLLLLREAELLFTSIDNAFDKGVFHMNYAHGLSLAKKIDQSIEENKKALRIFESQNAKENQLYILEALAKNYEEKGDFSLSNSALHKIFILIKEIHHQKVNENLNELALAFETEKKERLILEQKNELLVNEKKQRQYWFFGLSVTVLGLIGIGLQQYIVSKTRKKALLIANKIIEQNEMIKELEVFNYSVSHDIKHPLLQIDILLESIQNENLSPEARKDKIIHAQKLVHSSEKLIEALLKLSKINNSTIFKAKIDTIKLLESCISEFADIEDSNITLENLPKQIDGDIWLLKIAFSNLIDNAIKFSKNAIPFPHICICYEKNNEDHIFYVKDNGIGFQETQNSKLFLPFSRLHSNENIEGTGLGLVIVKRIIEKHGGRIKAYRETEKTVFECTIPIVLNH